MNLPIIILDILYMSLVGYVIVDILAPERISFLNKLSLSYPIGFGIVGFQLFVYFLIHIPWNIYYIVIPWIILFILYIKLKKPHIFPLSIKKILQVKFSRLEVLFLITILSLILFTGFESVLRPIQAWDGWDNWVFRSNVFFINKSVDSYYFKYTSDAYPLIIPLSVTFGYITLDNIDDTSILFFYFMFYTSLGMIFYNVSRNFMARLPALIFTFLLLSTQNIIRHGGRYEAGQADLAVGLYIFIGSYLLFIFNKYRTFKIMLLINLLLGITAQIKNDAIPFVILSLFIQLFILIKEKKYHYFLGFITLPLLYLPWQYFKIIGGLKVYFLFRQGINIHWDRIPIILFGFGKEFLNFQNWNLLWIVLIISFFISIKYRKSCWIFLLALITQIISYFSVFLITPVGPSIHMDNIINKLYLHIAPIGLLIIGILNATYFKNLRLLKVNILKKINKFIA